MVLHSKITQKGQATIPKEIRDILNLQNGDSIAFRVNEDNEIYLTKLLPIDKDYIQAVENTLEEWNSPEDEQAFAYLQEI